jgi:hypothetical protein
MNETKIYEITVPIDKLIFDFSGFEQERYGVNDIFAIIAVKYGGASKKKFNYINKI